jgi:LysR family transcriptional activator of nhaA
MDRLNYQHLFYFWMVAREGGLVPAGKVLRLSHPTLSAQVRSLEDHLGEQLFSRAGRKLVLTDVGRTVLRYADEIFSLGNELVDTIQDRATGKPLRLQVGAIDAVPKLLVRKLLEPALSLPHPVRLVCHEGSFDRLLGDLSQHALDVVIADAPVPPDSLVRAHHHLLGESAISLFATPALTRAHRAGFPRSLDGAPFLLPAENLPLRRSLNQWFSRHGIRPRVVAEFQDSALLKVFGEDGVGIFAAPAAVEHDLESRSGVELLGPAEGLSARYYAISVERRIEHPAVLAISRAAHDQIFAPRPRR